MFGKSVHGATEAGYRGNETTIKCMFHGFRMVCGFQTYTYCIFCAWELCARQIARYHAHNCGCRGHKVLVLLNEEKTLCHGRSQWHEYPNCITNHIHVSRWPSWWRHLRRNASKGTELTINELCYTNGKLNATNWFCGYQPHCVTWLNYRDFISVCHL